MIEVIIFGAVILCILVALLMYWSVAPFLVKLITLPFTIAFSLFTVWQMILLAGAPIKAFPDSKFDYIHHEVINAGRGLALWAYSERLEDFRLYIFPYTRERAKKLKEAQQRRKEGQKVKGQFRENKDKQGGHELVFQKGTPRTQTRPPKDESNRPQITP